MNPKKKSKYTEFDENYDFFFVEESWVKFLHPVSNYYLELNDLSINLLISLKWVKWGYRFFSFLSAELENSDELKNLYQIDTINSIITDSLQKFSEEFVNMEEFKHIISIDNIIVNDTIEFNKLLKDVYDTEMYNENSKISLKMKINLREYLIISNCLFPHLSTFEIVVMKQKNNKTLILTTTLHPQLNWCCQILRLL